MVRRVAVLLLALGVLPSIASAQSIRQSVDAQLTALLQAPTTAPSQNLANWQQQYDQAKRQKDGGKKKMLIGAAMAGGGVIIAATAADSCINSTLSGGTCTGSSAAARLGWIANLGGSGVFIWGVVEYMDGNGEMNRLSATKPTARSAKASVTLSARQSLEVQAGQRSSVGYRLHW